MMESVQHVNINIKHIVRLQHGHLMATITGMRVRIVDVLLNMITHNILEQHMQMEENVQLVREYIKRMEKLRRIQQALLNTGKNVHTRVVLGQVQNLITLVEHMKMEENVHTVIINIKAILIRI